MALEHILEIDDLNVEFSTAKGTLRALRNLNLRIPRGAIVGVVGRKWLR